ncbi:unnamed protein product [Chrysoparadoxa australica]
MMLPQRLTRMRWLGQGPHETYPDRKASGIIDVYQGSVASQHVPYMSPQENGGKSDVQWVALMPDGEGTGVLLKPCRSRDGAGWQANAAYYSTAEMEHAVQCKDLAPKQPGQAPVHLHLDCRHMGVGGDNSWLPDVTHPEYQISPGQYSYEMWIRPVNPGEEPEDVANSLG